ncbi:histidine kinase, partial [Frankia sp. AiPs1]|uniref:sensor histidine kinase n=1 Tax=Frankia sp. AiPs1 TaxID=573493 RepID=UPI0020433F31
PPGQRTRRRRPLRAIGDVAALLATAAVVIGGSHGAARDQVPPAHALDAPAFVLLALLAATVLLRRRAPLVMLLATSLLLGVFFAAGYPRGPAVAALVVAALSVGLRHDRRTSWRAVLVANVILLAGSAVGDARGYAAGGDWSLVFSTVEGITLCSVPALVGALIRLNRIAAAQADQEATRRRIEQERLRMAREVHDVVGHSLSVISLQAAVALHVLDRRPEQAQVALEAIRRTSVDALDELRTTLALTRAGQRAADPTSAPHPHRHPDPESDPHSDPHSDPESDPESDCESGHDIDCGNDHGFRPAAGDRGQASAWIGSVDPLVATGASRPAAPPLTGLGRLPSLLREVRLCGVPVELVTEGDVDRLAGLPADLDLAAYRIVQESLTNVLRHAPPGRTRVRIMLAAAGGRLTVDVTDRPEPPARSDDLAPARGTFPDPGLPSGQGLTGLGERAAELGGMLSAGPVAAGGWRVRAELPMPVGGPEHAKVHR